MKNNNRILVFGNFGYLTNDLNGQTLKTRSVYNLLNKNLIGNVYFFDTSNLYLKRIPILIFELIRCNKLIYIPALKNLKYLLPFIFLMSKLFFFKICFMARVSPLKGIDAIIRLANWLLINPVQDIEIIIDIYGPIGEGYKDIFFNKIKNITILNYLGVVQPSAVYSTFSNYDLSVLPTKYPGEGFPGSVLDSYISAVPVIVSNWRHLPEFVKHEKTGFIYNLDNEKEFYNYVKYLILNSNIVYNMKLNAFEESKLYSEKTAWKILNKHVIK